ncbi:hypothetical protein, partial [Latilactobacillus curvatus]|uniref:hypothetical protein n=1 Tax=Latilactobacillus curvatus TaxID=28038 RepID=UPI001F3AEDAA
MRLTTIRERSTLSLIHEFKLMLGAKRFQTHSIPKRAFQANFLRLALGIKLSTASLIRFPVLML